MNQRVEHKVALKQAKRDSKNANESIISPPQSDKASESPSRQQTLHFRPWESTDDSDDRSRKPVLERAMVAHRALLIGDTNPSLCAPMSTDWRISALCRFFRDYVVEANEVKVSPGYLNHLPRLYGEGSDEILTHAVSAVSLASFSNRVRSEELLIKGRKLYGKALLLVKRALSNPKQVTKDGTLAGVFFLNMYEVGHPVSVFRASGTER